jgi:ATP-dependent Clp protease ATP-binding subunit ClpC
MAQIQDPERPLLTMLFTGPTGVGKTETVRALAEVLFGNRRAFTRINCQEYSEHFTMSKLLGSPPGYVGGEIQPLLAQENIERHHRKAAAGRTGLVSEPGGRLARTFDPGEQGYLSLVLFDEIEKAHPKLWNLLLGILEDGTVILGDNEESDFRRAIIVLTTNVGGQAMGAHLGRENIGFDPGVSATQLERNVEEAAMRAARKIFPQEFLNRFDQFVTFRPLQHEDLVSILDNLILQFHRRCLRSAEPFLLQVTPAAKNRLIDAGYDPQFGARPLKRELEQSLVTPLSHYVVAEKVRRGDLGGVYVDPDGEGYLFLRRAADLPPRYGLKAARANESSWVSERRQVNDDSGAKEEVVEEVKRALSQAIEDGVGPLVRKPIE